MSDPQQRDGGTSGFALGYRPAFDGVRGIGVLIIMGAHSFLVGLSAVGVVALQFFFMLSGFLITVLLVREWERSGTVGLKNFYIRRGLRLLPALLVFLLVATIVVAFTLPEQLWKDHYRATAAALLYVYNWAFIYQWITGASVVSHCWSLSVEEQFYLLWPLTLLAILRLPIGRPSKMALVAAGAVAAMVSRAWLIWNPSPYPFRLVLGSDIWADALLVGCFLALAACWGYVPRRQSSVRLVRAAALIGVALAATYAISAPFLPLWLLYADSYGGQGLRVIGLGFMFLTLLVSPPTMVLRVLEAPLVVWFGRRSYSIYLWHLGINSYLVLLGRWSPVTIAVVGAVVAIVVAAASFRWLEAPFLRAKVRYSSEPAAAITVLAQTPDTPPADLTVRSL